MKIHSTLTRMISEYQQNKTTKLKTNKSDGSRYKHKEMTVSSSHNCASH